MFDFNYEKKGGDVSPRLFLTSLKENYKNHNLNNGAVVANGLVPIVRSGRMKMWSLLASY